MLKSLRQIFAREAEPKPGAAIPSGERVYAVGDIHGRLDLFEAIIDAIERDDAAQTPARTTIVLLGDLVDRGPESAGVIARARQWQQQRTVRILAGNHEEMFLSSFDDIEVLRHFLRFGGKETVLSYDIDRDAYNAADLEEVQAMMHAAVPEIDREFMRDFEDMIAIGDYVFVHAGILPGVPFEEQRRKDLRWIREPFLSHGDAHAAVVVHGHTISDEPVERANRIGIDTGAYSSGRLTALVLEGTTRRYIEAIDSEGSVTTAARELAA